LGGLATQDMFFNETHHHITITLYIIHTNEEFSEDTPFDMLVYGMQQ
jgi:hypothetical protein